MHMNSPTFQKYIHFALITLMVIAVVFVFATTQSLPAVVASHFDAAGVANGFMNRESYLITMLGVILGLPGLMVLTAMGFSKIPISMVNIPHREYWLAPERSAMTLQALKSFMWVLACLILVFLSFVHWLVVLANQQQTPAMSSNGIYTGLIVFLVLIGIWTWLLQRKFQLKDTPPTSANS